MQEILELYVKSVQEKSHSKALNAAVGLADIAKLKNKSICDITDDDVYEYVETSGLISLTSIRNYLQWVNGFVRFATETGVKLSLHDTLTYKDVNLVALINKYIVYDFNNFLRQLYEYGSPAEGFAIYPLIIFAWNGISLKDAPTIMIDDVHLEQASIDYNHQLTFDNMTNYEAKILSEYQSCSEAVRSNGMIRVPNRREWFIYRMDHKNFSKSKSSNAPINPNGRMASCLETMNLPDDLRQKCRYNSIATSGKLFKIYQLEKQGLNVATKFGRDYISKFLGSPTAYPGDGLLMYQAYKKAFNLK